MIPYWNRSWSESAERTDEHLRMYRFSQSIHRLGRTRRGQGIGGRQQRKSPVSRALRTEGEKVDLVGVKVEHASHEAKRRRTQHSDGG